MGHGVNMGGNVDGSSFDRATRSFESSSRRNILRSLAAVALGSATTAMFARPGAAADKSGARLGGYGDEVSSEKSSKKKKKQKRCRRNANACRVDVSGWCAAFWIDYGSCMASLGSCCSFVGKCKYGKADSCIANNPYYFLVESR
jgi:hypothetical protein